MQSISYQLRLFIYLYVHLWMSSTEQQGETQHIQQKCILPLKDRKTRGAEAGGREDKGLLWTETAENTGHQKGPQHQSPGSLHDHFIQRPTRDYSVLRGKGGRGEDPLIHSRLRFHKTIHLSFYWMEEKWELVTETDDKSQFECNLDKYLHTS